MYGLLQGNQNGQERSSELLKSRPSGVLRRNAILWVGETGTFET